MTLTELFTNIANAIRRKDGSTGSIPAEDFPERIDAIGSGLREIEWYKDTGITVQDTYTMVIQNEKISSDKLVALIVEAYWTNLNTNDVIVATVFNRRYSLGTTPDTSLTVLSRNNYTDYSPVNVSPIIETGKITIKLNGEGHSGVFNSKARYKYSILYEI